MYRLTLQTTSLSLLTHVYYRHMSSNKSHITHITIKMKRVEPQAVIKYMPLKMTPTLH